MRAAQQPANYSAVTRLQLQCMKCAVTFRVWKRRKNCEVRVFVVAHSVTWRSAHVSFCAMRTVLLERDA